MNVFEFMSSEYANWGVRWYVLGTLVVFFLIGLLVYLAYSKTELTVTDKRIYGTASFGKKS